MNNLKAIDVWREWAEENDAEVADVTPAPPEQVGDWFDKSQRGAAAKHFQAFAHTGDGTILALWSEQGGDFDAASVVALGGEGQLAWVADSAVGALALIAAAGDENLDGALSYGDLGSADEELSELVTKLGGEIPSTFELDGTRTEALMQFVAKLTGNTYRSFTD